MMRGAAERQARVQLMQHPRGLVQPTQTQPPVALPTPQVALPLHQPLPGWPATQCQQAVQPPGQSTGRGVAFDPSTEKAAPTSSPSSQDHGRPTTRGRGDGGRSISRPGGVQEEASVQPPHQEGDLPSGSTPSVPPPAAPEGAPPQHGGRPRSSLRDPARLVQNFAVRGGRRTWSMCSGSITNTTLPP